LVIYWQGPEEEIKVLDVNPFGQEWLKTSDGHSFVAKDAANLEVINSWKIRERQSQIIVHLPRPLDLRSDVEENFPGLGECLPRPPTEKYFESLAKKMTTAEQRARLERQRNDERRLWLNSEQPKILPKLTPRGYELRRIPQEAYDLLWNFYQRHRREAGIEKWSKSNSYVNHWEVPTSMIYVTQELRLAVSSILKPVLEQWSGQELQLSSMYGIRLYHNNSWLKDHVDVLSTHAVSAIMQVDQDVDEPWLLQIVAHDGVKVDVALDPGDILLYESASCIHGREKPMRGRYYANAFIHYRPKDGWDYNEKMLQK